MVRSTIETDRMFQLTGTNQLCTRSMAQEIRDDVPIPTFFSRVTFLRFKTIHSDQRAAADRPISRVRPLKSLNLKSSPTFFMATLVSRKGASEEEQNQIDQIFSRATSIIQNSRNFMSASLQDSVQYMETADLKQQSSLPVNWNLTCHWSWIAQWLVAKSILGNSADGLVWPWVISESGKASSQG